ncbi:hypothetical protein BCO9919_07520 [Burkholderia cenocepacia]|uniref:Uncharacterized protein n=2 Tax=Burkholderia TaxID=32008 RepID=A0A6J5JW95_9BURK|nr:hypothetical protein BCO9919_07520 [Burkholderia cenocepacia]
MSLASLDPKFLRRVGLLCCHCVRNIAYYRVGFVNEDGSGDLKQQTQFGATVNGDMLDIAVLEWCKLFADRKAVHHWRRGIRDEPEQQRFLEALLRHAGTNESGWTRYVDSVRVYRDKFVAHLGACQIFSVPRS